MRSTYAPVNVYTGVGNNAEYSFDFKIESLDQLLVIEMSGNEEVTERVRGDDTTYLASVDFDPVEGGGTVTLNANLTSGYKLYLILANDEPTQPYEFKDQGSFTLRDFEMSLDWLGGAIQRLSWLAQRAIRYHDTFEDDDAFDLQLPRSLTAEYLLGINEDGDGLQLYEPSGLSMSLQAEFDITEGQSATALDGETVDGTQFSSVVYEYEIIRGTTVFSVGRLSLHYRNSTWYYVNWGENYDGSAATSGVTFSLTGTATAQLCAAVATDGKGNGTIKLKKHRFTI